MFALLLSAALALTPATMTDAFHGREGAFVLLDCASGDAYRSDAAACAVKYAPCSTFKIWNSAIGLELGLVSDPDGPFWHWDGVSRSISDWNKDQTMRTAFAASCVPAYQALARTIGAKRMQAWLKKIGYGDRNISAGVDVFWLPEPGRITLLISADEQAELLKKLVTGKLPFSPPTLETLKTIMAVRTTPRGTLFGKTGTGEGDFGGWFVGYVESQGKTYAFACRLKGRGVMGKDARAVTEKILEGEKLL